MRDYKLVVLGAGGVGKSCLTVQFVQSVYLDTYDPTIEDSYRKTIEIDGKVFDLEILDTAGVAQFTAMRELYIKSGMGFLLVYSVTDKQSLDELMELREQVLRIKDSNKVPMVLVGNKADLADERIISVPEGIDVSTKWGRVPFYETSALLRSNVDEVFVDLVRQIIRNEMENVSKSDARKSNTQHKKNSSNENYTRIETVDEKANIKHNNSLKKKNIKNDNIKTTSNYNKSSSAAHNTKNISKVDQTNGSRTTNKDSRTTTAVNNTSEKKKSTNRCCVIV